MDLKRLGAIIISYRDARGWSQDELSGRSKVARGALQKLEKGRGNPTIGTLVALGAALGETLVTFPGETPLKPGKTVAQMSVTELEDLVGRASKRDGAINLEITRLRQQVDELMEYLPSEVLTERPKLDAWQVGLARFFLTGNQDYLKGVRKDVVESILRSLQFYKLSPSKAPRK